MSDYSERTPIGFPIGKQVIDPEKILATLLLQDIRLTKKTYIVEEFDKTKKELSDSAARKNKNELHSKLHEELKIIAQKNLNDSNQSTLHPHELREACIKAGVEENSVVFEIIQEFETKGEFFILDYNASNNEKSLIFEANNQDNQQIIRDLFSKMSAEVENNPYEELVSVVKPIDLKR